LVGVTAADRGKVGFSERILARSKQWSREYDADEYREMNVEMGFVGGFEAEVEDWSGVPFAFMF
ncbi:hypothetical protein KIPB_001601, partial [Kipferlia bialata]